MFKKDSIPLLIIILLELAILIIYQDEVKEIKEVIIGKFQERQSNLKKAATPVNERVKLKDEFTIPYDSTTFAKRKRLKPEL